MIFHQNRLQRLSGNNRSKYIAFKKSLKLQTLSDFDVAKFFK